MGMGSFCDSSRLRCQDASVLAQEQMGPVLRVLYRILLDSLADGGPFRRGYLAPYMRLAVGWML